MIPATIFDLSLPDEGCVALQDLILADPTLQEWHNNRVYRVHSVTDLVLKKFPPPAIYLMVVAEQSEYKPGPCVDWSYRLAVVSAISIEHVCLLPEEPSLSGVITRLKELVQENPQLKVARFSNAIKANAFGFQEQDYQEEGEAGGIPLLTHTFLIDYQRVGVPL